jgi:hypothetical protein
MCFTMDWLMQVLILCIIVGAIIQILKIVVPYALSKMGVAAGEGVAVVTRVLQIAFWALVAVIVVIIVFKIIACLWGFAGGSLGSVLPHR